MDPRFGQNNKPVRMGHVGQPAKDRFGTPIVKGSNVLYDPEIPLVFQVVDAKPILDPRAPTGSVQIVLVCQVPLTIPGGHPIGRLLSLGVAPGEVEVTDPPADPPADTPAEGIDPALPVEPPA